MYRKFQFLAEPVPEELPTGRAELPELLQRRDTRYRLVPLTRPDHVRLDAAARTPGGYRMTPAVCRALCDLVASGLHGLFCNLSGLNPLAGLPRAGYSVEAAARVFNICSRLRFSRPGGLSRRQFVSDEKYRVVDAVVGINYLIPSGAEFARTVFRASGVPELAAAVAYGRRIELYVPRGGPAGGNRWAVRVVLHEQQRSRFSVDIGRYCPGKGFACVRRYGAPPKGQSSMLMPRIATKVSQACEQELPQVTERILFGVPLPDGPEAEKQFSEIVDKSLPEHVIFQLWHDVRQSSDCTLLNLFDTMLYTAALCPADLRHKLERAAWKLVVRQSRPD